MRKQKKGRKLHRKRAQRDALMESMARALVLKGRITVTLARAKELKSFVEKKITKAKKGDLAARRELLRVFSNDVVKKLVEEIAPGYQKRPGGYARIIKAGIRTSDSSQMAIIEFVEKDEKRDTQN